MPKVSDIYSGAGLKADDDVADLEDGGTIFTIKNSEVVDFDEGSKLVLHFKETDKTLVVNKTNAKTLIELFKSDDSDDWHGNKIKLYAMDTTYNNKPMRGIRVASRPVKSSRPPAQDFDETSDDPSPPRRPKANADPESPDGPPF